MCPGSAWAILSMVIQRLYALKIQVMIGLCAKKRENPNKKIYVHLSKVLNMVLFISKYFKRLRNLFITSSQGKILLGI